MEKQVGETSALQEQIDRLEMKLAYQEDTIETLNQTVISQQNTIDDLQRTMNAVVEKLKAGASSNSNISQEQELPPHY